MKALKKYDIEIFKLNNGKHEYNFEINQEFFEIFESNLVEKGKGKIHIEVDKSETMLNMLVQGEGTVELECDRSLEMFDNPFDINEKIIFKYGEETAELNDNLYVIEKNTQKLNIAQILYDLIGLSIPMKKIHPKFREEDDDIEGEIIEGKLIYSSLDIVDDEIDENLLNESENEDTTDPRWDILKKLKDNNNN
jgi:uncharacterized protein